MTSGPVLCAEGIGVRFGDFQALNSMSLRVMPNTIHALIGPNGAGKTTLFNAISGIRPPNSGTVIFDGMRITETPAHRRVRYGMARSFQVTNIYPALSVKENIRLAVQARYSSESWVFWRSHSKRTDIRDEVRVIMQEVSLEERENVDAADLSHGAQRSLEIGMALAGRPKMVCLDEPLAGMGIDDLRSTKDLISNLKKRMAVLLIEHNMSIVLSISDRVTVMVQGRKIAEGTPEAIRRDKAVRAAYLGSQA
ncbi:ABC transporter ATP-binding protein [Rhizobium leguminosarum]|nr:ABC transporter ATP-binding protein [Rhizobium leguminosarum]